MNDTVAMISIDTLRAEIDQLNSQIEALDAKREDKQRGVCDLLAAEFLAKHNATTETLWVNDREGLQKRHCRFLRFGFNQFSDYFPVGEPRRADGTRVLGRHNHSMGREWTPTNRKIVK